jgi:hypothetical protein
MPWISCWISGQVLNATAVFDELLSARERKAIADLTSPFAVQAFLDAVPYSTDDRYRCPLSVLRDRRAHCFDGAVFAAALLERNGLPPLIVNLFAERDDEHLIAVYRRDGHWGAVAKSNFSGLRYREPVYRTLRELVISYFDDYYNLEGLRSLRTYTRPLNLRTFDAFDWRARDESMERIATRLDRLQRVALLTPRMIARLPPIDQRSYDAGMVGVDMAGVYRP